MSIEPVPEPLARFLRTYCNTSAMEMVQVLRERLQHNEILSDTALLFRQQFGDAIRNKSISPEQYNALTDDNECTTQEELQVWLSELWAEVFVGQEIPEQKESRPRR